MIRPIELTNTNNINNTNSLSFKGNVYYKNNERLSSDVFQSCTPKNKQGLWSKVKSAITAPFNSAAANITENKAAVMETIYGVVDDYNKNSYKNEEDVVFDLKKYYEDSFTFTKALKTASHPTPADGSSEIEMQKGSNIKYETVNGQKVPVELTHGEKEDENGVVSAKVYIDFSGEIYDNIKVYPETSNIAFEADKVSVLTTANKSTEGMDDLAKNLGGPFIAHNIKKTSNGVYYADSITVFHRDSQGKVKSATTYNNAKIDNTLNNSSVPAEKRIFGIQADEVFKSHINNKGIQDSAYYQNYDKFTIITDSPEMRDDAFKTKYSTCESAEAALEKLPESKAKVMLNYSKSDLDGVLYSERKTVNL